MDNLSSNRRSRLVALVAFGSILFIIIVGGLVLHHHSTAPGTSQQQQQTAFPAGRPIGVWSRKAADTYAATELENQARALQNAHVTDIYTDISTYADYYSLANSSEKDADIAKLTTDLDAFIATFQQHNITTHALAGNAAWSNPEKWYLPQAIEAFVHDFNNRKTPHIINSKTGKASAPAKFASLQFDIASYNESSFTSDPQANLTQYLQLTQSLVVQQTNSGTPLALGFTIPYWFDNERGTTPPFVFNGSNEVPVNHLIDQLAGNPGGGSIAVMTYTHDPTSAASIIRHTQQEIAYASHTPPVKVDISLDTTKPGANQATFYGQPLSKLAQTTRTITAAFNDQPAYRGFVINDASGLLSLHQ